MEHNIRFGSFSHVPGVFRINVDEPAPPQPDKLSMCVAPAASGEGGAADSITCSTDPKIIPNGSDTTTASVEVKDKQGGPVKDNQVSFTTSPNLGSFPEGSTCTTDNEGKCSVKYQAPRASEVFASGTAEEKVTIQAETTGLQSQPAAVDVIVFGAD